ncbi:hypothetical protein CHF27_013100 [Romboutsia maritimum]|uniref:Uncharacterized protein n=1 Tax=Romboutsia maritimum TaxID=2020948 RepID=A0A371IPV4_9FIRM|nr:hypothetical protein CHF27_013100 [Romboutsia maritimum]
MGDDFFSLEEGIGVEILDNFKILQGYIELSNISMQNEMTDLILVKKDFYLIIEELNP